MRTTRTTEELTLRALAKSGINNKVVVCRDGADALNYIFGRGDYKGRDPVDYPAITLLDLKLPKVYGLTVLERIRGDSRTTWRAWRPGAAKAR